MKPSRVRIAVGGGAEVTGALAGPPDGAPFAISLAHGAGGDMDAPLLVAVAGALAERGYLTLRWNFLYKERGKSAPDPAAVLERTTRAVAAWLRPRARRLALGGKSMGGRYASIAASKGLACDALVFLGYPLHPAGRPEQLRDAHLPAVAAPMLFVQGTRDPLCRLELLRPVLARLGPRARLYVVEGGDHGLDVLKSLGRTKASVVDEVAGEIDRFLVDVRG
ncbi:MAG TPA: alpha/beta family hydrolase [Minicystis sp.]|nr:alpha/beta family hydrolase [Minicystis sp.]